MLRYRKYSRIFLAPEPSGGGGGSSGNPAAAQAGAVEQDNGSSFKDPTAGIDLDDLPPDVRKVIEESRKGFAALQKQAADTEAARIAEENRRKDFQSNYDKLRIQVESLTNSGAVKNDDPAAEQLKKFTQILVKRGVPEAQAKVQAEIMTEMMGDFGVELKKQIGADLRPFAATVVSREAESSWHQAVHSDKVGVLQHPDLAQQVWAQVQDMAQNGQQVTPQIVTNLAGMAYMDHLQKGGQPLGGNQQTTVPPQQQQQQQLPQVGRLTYPGAGAAASRPPTFDPSAARTVLDPDTDAALQSVMKTWANGQGGVKAPGLRIASKGGR